MGKTVTNQGRWHRWPCAALRGASARPPGCGISDAHPIPTRHDEQPAPSPNQIRFQVEPRLVPDQKAASRLHLTEAQFKEKLGALLLAGMPPACPVTGRYDLKAIDAWLFP